MTKLWRVVNVTDEGVPKVNDTWRTSDEKFRTRIFIPKKDYVIIADTPDVCVRLLPLQGNRKILQLFYAVEDDKP